MLMKKGGATQSSIATFFFVRGGLLTIQYQIWETLNYCDDIPKWEEACIAIRFIPIRSISNRPEPKPEPWDDQLPLREYIYVSRDR
jgi:hypothetical protein